VKVVLRGDLASPSGYSAHARALVQSLIKVPGIEVGIEHVKQSQGTLPLPPEEQQLYAEMMNRSWDKPDVRINFLTPPYYMFQKGVYTIGFTMWETTNICDREVQGQRGWNWVGQMNQCDEIWTGCASSVEAFARSGLQVTANVIPGPVDTDLYKPDLPELNIPEVTIMTDGIEISKDQRPKSIGFIGDWNARKNIDGWLGVIISQFVLKPVVGILKTRLPGDIDQHRALQALVSKRRAELRLGSRRPMICLIPEILSDGDIARLYSSMDCYMSLSRGEGLDLPTLQAMACGVPVIHTNFGATKDYLTPETGFPIQYTYTIVEGMKHGPYFSDMWWAEPDLHSATRVLADLLTSIESDPGALSDLLACARKRVQDFHSIPAITSLLVERLDV